MTTGEFKAHVVAVRETYQAVLAARREEAEGLDGFEKILGQQFWSVQIETVGAFADALLRALGESEEKGATPG